MNETIAAVSTPFGRGGIAVIRISGEETMDIVSKIFRPASGKPIDSYNANSAIHGSIIKSGKIIDDGICTVFYAPRSFTGEDVAEISCHGGILLTERVLEAAFEAGAKPAAPGEFTRRAFTSGKLSLSQAEAVGLLIDAVSDEQLSIAAASERGVFKKKADELYEKLKRVVTSIYAVVDFPDEDLAELSENELVNELLELKSELSMLKGTYNSVRVATEGINAVIVGKPNTGKSSLLNRLVGRDRAIVTDIAGTTRDTLEEKVNLGKVILLLSDTAGIHETDDTVERIGVERSLEALERAELVLAIFDGSDSLKEEDIELLKRLPTGVCKLALINKTDLGEKLTASELSIGEVSFDAVIPISAKDGVGIDALKEKIESLFVDGKIDYDSQAVVMNARQNASVVRTYGYIESALDRLSLGETPDTVGFELESALSELSELDGRRVTEEIVDDIFHRFCVGK